MIDIRDIATKSIGSIAAPALIARGLFDHTWKNTLPDRSGFGAWGDWRIVKKHSPRIWFHAASVGEVAGLAPVISSLKEESSDIQLLVSTTSVTGREEVLKRELCDKPCLLPLDYPLAVRRAFRAANPDLLVINETEIWPNLLSEARVSGVPVVLINGRISDYSYPRYRAIRWFMEPAFKSLDVVLVQTEIDATRFSKLGVPEARIRVTGSTKYDQPSVISIDDREGFAAELGIDSAKPCFVAGSVRPGEDLKVVQAYKSAVASIAELQMVIAPRHPERFEAVAKLLNEQGIDFGRRSDASSLNKAVVLLDTLGELQNAYALADVAFVGGTLVDIGGHNPLEPARYDVPVLFGPYTSNVRDSAAELLRSGAAVEVQNIRDLSSAIQNFCSDFDKRSEAGKAAHAVWLANLGATEKVVECLKEYFADKFVSEQAESSSSTNNANQDLREA